MSYLTIKYEREEALAIITLNRPEKRNAIDQQMINEMHQLLDELYRDMSLGAVILTGAGEKAFAAGADIGQLRDRKQESALSAINQSMFRRMEELPVPTIAAVRGYALGGGCELALTCDMRVAGEGAKLGQPEVGLGIVPGAGGTQRLARLIGLSRAKELIFSGRIIDAAEAARIGLVNHVVPDEHVFERAHQLATEILGQSQLAVRIAKAAINAQYEIGPAPGYQIETIGQAILFEDEEKYRRMTEFLDRKKQRKK